MPSSKWVLVHCSRKKTGFSYWDSLWWSNLKWHLSCEIVPWIVKSASRPSTMGGDRIDVILNPNALWSIAVSIVYVIPWLAGCGCIFLDLPLFSSILRCGGSGEIPATNVFELFNAVSNVLGQLKIILIVIHNNNNTRVNGANLHFCSS